MAGRSDDRPSSKVARLIDEYDLEELGAELEARWIGDGVERSSLRDLADLFNRRLVERALLNGGMNALERDVEIIYENLTDEGVSTGVRTDTRNRLKRNGIDPDKLERDFVTYQAVRTYLKEWRDAEYEPLSDTEKLKKDHESIQRLMSRTLSVIEDRIKKLRETDRIDIREFEVIFDAQVLCQECGTQQSVTEFLDNGGCPCQRMQ